MGKVYRARDTRLERTVAIKFLHGRAVDDPDRRMRFLREARAEAALYHPNIATVLDVGEAEVDDPDLMPARHPEDESRATRIVPYIVLEFVAGQDLRRRIFDGPLPLAETLRIARQIVAGLEAAHAAGIVHRDLKPANVLVTDSGLVKILDFGLARFVSPVPPSADSPTDLQTAEGAILGTPPYLAPEQAAGQPLDARADLFALGVMLYQMTTGLLPFRGDNPIDLLQSTLRDDPYDLAEHAPGLPPRFTALVTKLLKKHPIDRPASAAEVARELDALARELGDAPTSVTGAGATPGTLATRRVKPGRATLAVVAAIVAVAAISFALFARQQARAEAWKLYEQGQQTLDLGDPQAYRLAAEQFGRATVVDPNFALAWAAKGQALLRAYERDRADELLQQASDAADRALAIAPSLVEAKIVGARLALLRGQIAQGVSTLEGLLLAPGASRAAVLRELGNAYERQGNRAKAEESFLAAVAAEPEAWRPWSELGGFRIRAGNYPGARAAYERAKEKAPSTVTVPAENLATLLYLEGRYDDALVAYEAIRGEIADADAASNLGTLYYFNARFDDAERSFRKAIQISPRQPMYHRNLADSLLRLGRADEARSEYSQALLLVEALLTATPGDLDLRLERSLYLARAGRCRDAVEYSNLLHAELPESAASSHALARPLALCGELEKAVALLQRSVALGYPAALLRDEDELAALRGIEGFEMLARREAAGR